MTGTRPENLSCEAFALKLSLKQIHTAAIRCYLFALPHLVALLLLLQLACFSSQPFYLSDREEAEGSVNFRPDAPISSTLSEGRDPQPRTAPHDQS